MAEGFKEISLDQLSTPSGINELTRMLGQLYDNMAGDAENVRIYSGYGTPESVVTAGIGSVFMRYDGGSGSTVYLKESGTLATGWVAIDKLTTPISLANGGTGQVLVDPANDRILFWDDSEGKIDWLVPNDSLSITGTNLNVDAVNGSAVASFLVYDAGTQAYSDGTLAKKTFDTDTTGEAFDTGGNFASSTFTAPSTGTYMFTCNFTFDPDGNMTDDDHRIQIWGYKEAAKTVLMGGWNATAGADAADVLLMSGSTIIQLTATDTFEIYLEVNTGATMTFTGGILANNFSGTLLA